MAILKRYWVIVAALGGAVAAPLLAMLLMRVVEIVDTANHPGSITILFDPQITIPALGNLSITGNALWSVLALMGAIAGIVLASACGLLAAKIKSH